MSGQVLSCPQCQARLRLGAEQATGVKVRCPKCQTVFRCPLSSASVENQVREKPPQPVPQIKKIPKDEMDFSKAKKRSRSVAIRSRKIEIGILLLVTGLILGGVAYYIWMLDPPKNTLARRPVAQRPPIVANDNPALNRPPDRSPRPVVEAANALQPANNAEIPANQGEELPIQTIVHLLVPKEKAHGPAVVVLEKPSEPGPFRTQFRGVLARELVRQAFGISVRDELGLATRDLGLGETYPAPVDYRSSGDFALKISFFKDKPLAITLEKKTGDQWARVYKKEIPVAPPESMDYLKLTSDLEELARQEWPGVLTKQGFPSQQKPAKSDDKADAVTSRLLDSMNYFAQFAALRAVQEAIRRHGESPWLEGDLVRGYAQLGRLLRFHWNAAYKVCHARSLLYAARLSAKNPASPWGAWHRAYAAGLSGFPNAALADLATAAAAEKNFTPKVPPPDWIPIVDAFCRSDKKSLSAMKAPLARFLGLPWQRVQAGDAKALLAIQKFLVENPDCYTVWDGLCNTDLLNVQHQATVAPLALMTSNLPARILEIQGLPAEVERVVSGNANFGLAEESLLLRSLENAAALERDAGELAWSALAGLIRDTRFAQVFKRLDFLQRRLAAPVHDEFVELRPLVAEHPLLPFLERLSISQVAEIAGARRKVVAAIDPAQFTPLFSLIVGELDNADVNRKWGSVLLHTHCDETTSDLTALILYPFSRQKAPYARRLRKIDAHSTLALVTLIGTDWKEVANEAAGWEQTYGDKLDILDMLGRRYLAMARFADAERCFRKCLAISPDMKGYFALADCYKKQNKDALWLDAMKEVLKLPNLGLEQAQVRVTIANFYMAKKEYDKALPFANEAAQSWAEWAMRSASLCHEKLERWQESEMWAQRISDRYAGVSREWYHWCLRTGRGKLMDAALFAQRHPAVTLNVSPVEDLWIQVHLATLNQQPQEVLAVFDKNKVLTKQAPQWYLFVALLSEELHRAADRDQALKNVPADTSAGRLAQMFQERLRKPATPFDKKKVDDWLAKDSQQGAFGCYFLVGRILELTGEQELALSYYQRAINDANINAYIRPLAVQAIRAMGKEPEWRTK
jgi:predicted Zn finger-like uncharacterized protein